MTATTPRAAIRGTKSSAATITRAAWPATASSSPRAALNITARKQHIGFAPQLTPENFKCAFTSAEGWGSFSQTAEGGKLKAEISVRWGRLNLKTIALASESATSARVQHAGKTVAAGLKREGNRVLLSLNHPVNINAGEQLEISLS